MAFSIVAGCLLVSGLQPRIVAGLAVPLTSDRPVPPPAAPRPAPAGPTSRLERPDDCAPLVGGLDLRAQVAQLVVVGVSGDNPADTVALVRDHQVGGIFVGGNATALLKDRSLAAVQAVARVPVAVSVDEEGGRVQRIDDLDGDLPSARTMAATKSPDEVHALAAERGRRLRARGVTVDFAPDTDVTGAPDDDVIGDRSFSPDPARVKTYAKAFAEGLRDAGVQPVLKHFPGHGHGSGDSHEGTVVTPPLDRLRAVDLVPYRGLADYGPVAVMVGHLDVPDLTGGVPASLSPAAYRLLRGEFAFAGPVVTDDLGAMKAVTAQYPLPEAVLKALQAGADEALWSSGGRVDEVLDRLVKAVQAGELPKARVQESVTRVLRGKGLC
ncbi:beta-glucosidase [Amycolatopsis mediterranei S699]|uniref:beta-N-acetylhexosaminidase n=2 Tax=Amycolatopsis mediterranei TaxID=33910 RepID=A0A0H3DI85_AMYMU|nr:glycoside hydrolase family 3 N-terminal domain-containing protein [Amycolatopsis mediterranei]ADJ49828.1 beta-glucosidase [Amycolatopsis mediterranei U32]AEK46816.1 beta-glucosidase [Amycolatopsis mediterranei S699]AFO81536.1 beta-glucosidase [Amycolatopsis mediterranei S699]AGT88665.1 beta-glucosidase [Amycolatopsis mediterranei RB]KDO07922.1 beta-glucosidase [Amycolatopsis mediterranei]